MKKYKVTVTHRQKKTVLFETIEDSPTKKYLEAKYYYKYMGATVTVEQFTENKNTQAELNFD